MSTRLYKTLLVCQLTTSVPISFAQMPDLMMLDSHLPIRDAKSTTTCASDSSLVQCPSTLPSSFCCPSATTCLSLATNASTAICCPSGQDCAYIQPISCDVTQQNATEYPSNMVHTLELDAQLQTCGTECCPLGYTCQGDLCSMDVESPDTGSAQSSASSTSAGTATSPTSSPVIVPTAQPNSKGSTTAAATKYPAGAIVLGLFLGLLFGVAIVTVFWWLLRQRRRQKAARIAGADSPDFMCNIPPLHSQNISGPIDESPFSGSTRSDFLFRADAPPRTASLTSASRASNAGKKHADPHSDKISWSSDGGVPVLGVAAASARGARVRGRVANTFGGQLNRACAKIPTEQQQMASRGTGVIPPLLPSPLRFGLPVTPTPVPRRPFRNEGEPAASRNISSSRRPVGDASPEQALLKQQPVVSRSSSTSTHTSIDTHESYTSRRQSSGTINVLMRPPTFFERGSRHDSDGTTWGGMIEQAKLGRSAKR